MADIRGGGYQPTPVMGMQSPLVGMEGQGGIPGMQMFNPGASSFGGQQNVPQGMFSGSQNGMPGFGGYNAGMANGGGMTPYGQMMMGQQGGGMQNSYTMPQQGGYPGAYPQQPQNGSSYLQNIAAGGGAGAPVNQLPAWGAMVGAQNYNLQQGADSLAEQFNNGGGLFSTAYGNAQGQYQEQARLGQNAQLTNAVTQSQQAANQNQYGAAGQLSSQGYGADSLAAQLSQQSNLAGMQNNQAMYSLGLQGAGLQGSLYNQNLNTGMNLGNQQLLSQQNGLTAAYQNWYQSQPQNNPLLSMMYAGATGYPQMTQPTYNPGSLGSLLGGLGGLAGGIGGLGGAGGLGALIGLSDRRFKENIKQIGEIDSTPVYRFDFKGDGPKGVVGFVAQELAKTHPEAVIKGNETQPWLIDFNKLAQTLGVN